MIDPKDIIIKSLCDTIERKEKEINYLIQEKEDLREEIVELRERIRS